MSLASTPAIAHSGLIAPAGGPPRRIDPDMSSFTVLAHEVTVGARVISPATGEVYTVLAADHRLAHSALTLTRVSDGVTHETHIVPSDLAFTVVAA